MYVYQSVTPIDSFYYSFVSKAFGTGYQPGIAGSIWRSEANYYATMRSSLDETRGWFFYKWVGYSNPICVMCIEGCDMYSWLWGTGELSSAKIFRSIIISSLALVLWSKTFAYYGLLLGCNSNTPVDVLLIRTRLLPPPETEPEAGRRLLDVSYCF